MGMKSTYFTFGALTGMLFISTIARVSSDYNEATSLENKVEQNIEAPQTEKPALSYQPKTREILQSIIPLDIDGDKIDDIAITYYDSEKYGGTKMNVYLFRNEKGRFVPYNPNNKD